MFPFIEITETTIKNQINIIKTNLSDNKIMVISGILGIGISIISWPFIMPPFRKQCLPYVPSRSIQLKNIFSILTGHEGKLIDVGSGDGRIVVAAAKRGYIAHGVELNPWLVKFSKLRAYKDGVLNKTLFIHGDFWTYNLSSYDYIIIFGVTKIMARIEDKFLKEAKNNTTILTCRYPLPNLSPIKIIGNGLNTVWVYKINKDDSKSIENY